MKKTAKKPLSRQRLWQIEAQATGRCIICGKPRNAYKHLCDEHARKHAEYARKKRGLKAWREGGPGRKPKVDVTAS